MISKLRRLRVVLAKPAEDRSLNEKLLVSSGLTGAEYAINILFRILSTLVLTRLLSPEIFGVMGVILMFQMILVMLTDFGVRPLIVVSDHASDPNFLKTCWTVQVLHGLCTYGIILLLALLIWNMQELRLTGETGVYAQPVLAPALAVAGLQLVLQGLESVNQSFYARDMRFGRITLINLTASVFAPVAAIAIAWIWPSVWALVISGLLAATLRLIMTFVLFNGPTMGICWRSEYVSELIHRGKWIVSHSALSILTNTADKILFSMFLSASAFGTYSLATQIIDIPRNLLGRIQSNLFLQVFRSLDESGDVQAMRRQYYRYRAPFDALACMVAGGLITAAPAVIDLMYDPRYAQAGEILQILALGLPLLGMGLIREAFIARKKLMLMTLVGFVQAVSIWLGMLVALPALGSAMGALLVVALHRVPELLLLLGLAQREGWVVPLKEIRMVPVIAVGALLGLGVDYLWLWSNTL